MTKVTFESPTTPTVRIGTAVGYVQVPPSTPDNMNIYAIVIDDLTGVFCALPLWKLNAGKGGNVT